MRRARVGAPSYFAGHPRPATPKDLTEHFIISRRLPTLAGLYAWEFEKKRRELGPGLSACRVKHPNHNPAYRVAGLGLPYVPEDRASLVSQADS